jgi:sec-independent protein translocase protein TatC
MAKRRVVVIEDDDTSPDEADLEGGRMPFLAHLAELRDRLRNAAIAFGLAFLVCWYYAKEIFAWLRQPLFDIWIRHCEHTAMTPQCLGHGIPSAQNWGPPKMIYYGLTQQIGVDMSFGVWAGSFVASPCMCFLLSYNSRDLLSLPNIQEYLDLTRDSMLAFGAIFELPLLIYFLSLIGLVTHRGLWKFSRWFVVLSFVIGAVLTPGPDVISQLLMAMPMIALYNISILLSWWVTRKREKKQEMQRLADLAEQQSRPAARTEDGGGDETGGDDG